MPPKRARSDSPAADACSSPPAKRRARQPSVVPAASVVGCSLPLTRENLGAISGTSRLASSAAPSPSPMVSSRSGSPTRRNFDERTTLEAYNIFVDVHPRTPLPPELQAHVDDILLQLYHGPRSPNASEIVEQRPAAALENEICGIRMIEPLLLFAGEARPAPGNTNITTPARGIPKLVDKLNRNLERGFLPPPPTPAVLEAYGRLSRPQPDTAIGYISGTECGTSYPPKERAFTPEEEMVLNVFSLDTAIHAPFLTSQWKPATGDPHVHAQFQSARDGALIVNYLHELYTTAHGRDATAVEASHVSVTCDMQLVCIWIHWRAIDPASNKPAFYMKLLFETTLRNEETLSRARGILWNVIHYALETRLVSIKKALPLFSQRTTRTKKGKAARTASVSSASAAAFDPHALAQFPPTPLSTGDVDSQQPAKKRSRLDDRGE